MKTLLKQALTALESYQVLSCVGGGAYDPECADDKVGEAITALRAAIDQPESEPVAWMTPDGMHAMPADEKDAWLESKRMLEAVTDYSIPLYAAPVQPKKFKTLHTDGYSLNRSLGQRLVDSNNEFVAYLEPVADYVPLTDRQIYDCFVSSLGEHGAESYEEMIATVEWPGLTLVARDIERAVRGDK